MQNCCVRFVLLTSVRPGFYPRSEDRKGDTVCHARCYTESVRNSVNQFKPLANTLAWLLFPPLWLAYLLQCHLQFQWSQVNELDTETAFHVVPLLGTVSKNQKRRDSEQVCLGVCLRFVACPETATKHCPTARAPMSNCSSQGPSLAQERNQANPSPPLFPWGAAHLSPCTQPTALAREWQGLSHGCSCLLSTLPHPLVACGWEH